MEKYILVNKLPTLKIPLECMIQPNQKTEREKEKKQMEDDCLANLLFFVCN